MPRRSLPTSPTPRFRKLTPSPRAVGSRREARKLSGRTPAPGSGPPATPRAERSPPGTNEPCGSRAPPYLQTPGKSWGLQSAPQDSRGQGESLGSLHLPPFSGPKPRVFSPSPHFPSPKVRPTWFSLARSQRRPGLVKAAAPALGELW